MAVCKNVTWAHEEASAVEIFTGHFNFAAGLMLTAVGVGASFSDLVAGWLAAAFSFRTAFLFLSAVAALAALLYAVGMRETYPSRELNPA